MCTGHRHGLETERTQCTLHPGVEVSSELRALRTDTCGPAKGSSQPADSGAGSKRCKPPGLGVVVMQHYHGNMQLIQMAFGKENPNPDLRTWPNLLSELLRV